MATRKPNVLPANAYAKPLADVFGQLAGLGQDSGPRLTLHLPALGSEPKWVVSSIEFAEMTPAQRREWWLKRRRWLLIEGE